MAEINAKNASDEIEKRIYSIRGQRVMFDHDLAALYEVKTEVIVRATQRNKERFPEEFAFQLSYQEVRDLIRQSGGSRLQLNDNTNARQGAVFSFERHGGRRKLPYVYTEHGIVMLSSVLRSEKAAVVNVEIVRAFIRLRRMLASHAELAQRLNELERRYDSQFKVVFDAIRRLMTPPVPPRSKIGFR